MSGERQEYELGADVTQAAQQKARRQTAVLSVRLPVSDISAIESASETCGKTTAQIVREALTAYLQTMHLRMNQPSITISWSNEGPTTSTGLPRPSNRAARTETRNWDPGREALPA